jgi:hypothetical protein
MEAEERRCFVAVWIAPVRASGEGEEVAEEWSGWRAARERSVYVCPNADRVKKSSWSRLLSFIRGGSRPGIGDEVMIGRHSGVGEVLRTMSTSSPAIGRLLRPASRAKR